MTDFYQNLLINKKIARDEFLKKLADEFKKSYEVFTKFGFKYIEDEYLSKACFLNKEIVVSVLPFDADIGKNLIVTSTSPMIAFVENDTVVIDGNEIYKEGDGSQANPYIIK